MNSRYPLSKSLLFALLAQLLVLVGSGTAQVAPLQVKYADYRGTDEVMVTAPGFSITNAQTYRYMVLTGIGDPKDLIEWRKLNDAQKLIMQGVLDQQIYLEMIYPKYGGANDAAAVGLEAKGEQVLAGAAARLLWADKVVRDTVHVFPEDLYYHLLKNPKEYYEPETVVIRRLRVPTPAPVTFSVRAAALERAQELRARAGAEGGLAPLLEADASLLIDPPGSTLTIDRGKSDVDAQILDEAFGLGVSQISRPIQTPGGFILIEVLEHNKAEPFDPAAVLPAIKKDLMEVLLPQQFDYLMLKRYIKSFPVDRSAFYEFMSGDSFLIYMDDFTVTVDEFNALYPELIGDPELPNKIAIAGQTYNLIASEIARRDLQKLGLLDDPFYQESLQLAGKLFKNAQYARAEIAKIDPTPEDLEKFIAENQADLQPGNAKEVWALRLSPRRSSDFNREELETLQILMQNYMNSAVTDVGARIAKARRTATLESPFDPEETLRSIPQPSDSRVRLRAEKVGSFTKFDAQSALGVKYEYLLMDKFTPALPLRGGSVVSYFVVSEEPGPLLTDKQVMGIARLLYATKTAFKAEMDLIEGWKKSGELLYAPELNTAIPPAAEETRSEAATPTPTATPTE